MAGAPGSQALPSWLPWDPHGRSGLVGGRCSSLVYVGTWGAQPPSGPGAQGQAAAGHMSGLTVSPRALGWAPKPTQLPAFAQGPHSLAPRAQSSPCVELRPLLERLDRRSGGWEWGGASDKALCWKWPCHTLGTWHLPRPSQINSLQDGSLVECQALLPMTR